MKLYWVRNLFINVHLASKGEQEELNRSAMLRRTTNPPNLK